jgi:WhiB family transcriptional regulator, redox-sensing transcriptional regulator
MNSLSRRIQHSPGTPGEQMLDHRLGGGSSTCGRAAGRRPGVRVLRPVPAPQLPCRSEPELFFAEDPRKLERARELCRSCPVRAACLADALQRGEPWGVWGGEMLDRGAVIVAKRARGRPRKAGLAG